MRSYVLKIMNLKINRFKGQKMTKMTMKNYKEQY